MPTREESLSNVGYAWHTPMAVLCERLQLDLPDQGAVRAISSSPPVSARLYDSPSVLGSGASYRVPPKVRRTGYILTTVPLLDAAGPPVAYIHVVCPVLPITLVKNHALVGKRVVALLAKRFAIVHFLRSWSSSRFQCVAGGFAMPTR